MSLYQIPFIFHTDPGHGWLEVTPQDLEIVGLDISAFSSFSYREHDGKSFYLEEDCDAGVFIKAYVSRFGKKPKVEEKYVEECGIRWLPCIHAEEFTVKVGHGQTDTVWAVPDTVYIPD